MDNGPVEKPIADFFKKKTGEAVEEDTGGVEPIVESYFAHVIKNKKKKVKNGHS